MNEPRSIAINSQDSIYVCDSVNNRIMKYDLHGTLVNDWGQYGNTLTTFRYVAGIATDAHDNVYVLDSGDKTIKKYDRAGQWQMTFGGESIFTAPIGLAGDPQDNIYVADSSAGLVKKFDPSGRFVFSVPVRTPRANSVAVPSSVTIANNTLYVLTEIRTTQPSYLLDANVQMFSRDGTYIGTFGSAGSNDDQFWGGVLAHDAHGNVYVGYDQRVHIFTGTGVFIRNVSSIGIGTKPGQFQTVTGLAVN